MTANKLQVWAVLPEVTFKKYAIIGWQKKDSVQLNVLRYFVIPVLFIKWIKFVRNPITQDVSMKYFQRF